MDWDDARYFLAVARDGRMLGAARRLGVSQARLSRRIASLEESLGTTLLERTTRGCRLTEDGRAMFTAAERAEAEFLDGLGRLGQQGGEIEGTVRIGAPDGFGSAFLAPRLHHLTAAYPKLHIQLVPMATNLLALPARGGCGGDGRPSREGPGFASAGSPTTPSGSTQRKPTSTGRGGPKRWRTSRTTR